MQLRGERTRPRVPWSAPSPTTRAPQRIHSLVTCSQGHPTGEGAVGTRGGAYAIDTMKTKKLPPVHPGEILLRDFMEPLGLSQYALAKALGVTPIRVSQIVRGQRAITADTALRLSRYFGTRPDWWLDLQSHYDLELAADRAEARIARTVKPCPLLPGSVAVPA